MKNKTLILSLTPAMLAVILLIFDLITSDKYKFYIDIAWIVGICYTLFIGYVTLEWIPKREKRIYKDGYFEVTNYFNTDTLNWYKEYCYYKDNALLYSWKLNSMSRAEIILKDHIFINLLNKPIREISFLYDDGVKTVTANSSVNIDITVKDLFSDSFIESLMVQTEK